MEIIKKFWLIILIGLILRLVIAGFTFHPDLRTPPLSSAVFFQEGSVNFYHDSSKLDKQDVLDKLPLNYFINLTFHSILRPFVSTNIENQFFTDQSRLYGNPQFWFYLIYAKFPMIVFDTALGILLSFVVEGTLRKKVLILWLFNPFTLWVTSAIGQDDVYAAFFIVLSWFLIKRNQLNWAALSLGAGGAIKSAPFLLVPLLIGLGKNWTERALILILAALPYLATVVPYLGVANFRHNALLAPQLSKSLYANIPLSGGEMILLVPTILGLLYLFYFSKKRETKDFLNFSIAVLLLILSFTHFHLQWFLWVLPFLLLWLINHWDQGIRWAMVGLSVGLLIMLFLFESSLQVKLLSPLIPALDSASGLKELLTDQQGIFIRSIGASIFAGSAFFLIWRVLIRDSEKISE